MHGTQNFNRGALLPVGCKRRSRCHALAGQVPRGVLVVRAHGVHHGRHIDGPRRCCWSHASNVRVRFLLLVPHTLLFVSKSTWARYYRHSYTDRTPVRALYPWQRTTLQRPRTYFSTNIRIPDVILRPGLRFPDLRTLKRGRVGCPADVLCVRCWQGGVRLGCRQMPISVPCTMCRD